MATYANIIDATTAAQEFFSENFNHTSGVGIETRIGNKVAFFSKDDPAMEDTFSCVIADILPVDIKDFSNDDFRVLAWKLQPEAKWINDTHCIAWNLEYDVCLTIVVGNNDSLYRISDANNNILWTHNTNQDGDL